MSLQLDPGREPIPGYKLVKLLGEGGFGQVWQATAPGGVRVALKFVRLDTNQADPELRAVEVVKNIGHPHLLDIQFAVHVDDRLVLAMPLCERSLWDRLKECRAEGLVGIPFDELFEYMQDAAKAIDYLNEARHEGPDGRLVAVAHRDVKPHNIFLVGGSVKVADFGLVKALERSVASNTGSMTPAYAPPEMFGKAVSPRSDQWSLAVTYYQLRSGLLPFTGTLHEMMFAILQQPPDLSGIESTEECAAIAKALEKDPHNRWPSCREFVSAIGQSVRVGSPVPAGVVGFGDPPAIPSNPADVESADPEAGDVWDTAGDLKSTADTVPPPDEGSTPRSEDRSPRRIQQTVDRGKARRSLGAMGAIGLAVAVLLGVAYWRAGHNRKAGENETAGAQVAKIDPPAHKETTLVAAPPPALIPDAPTPGPPTPPSVLAASTEPSKPPAPIKPAAVPAVIRVHVTPEDATLSVSPEEAKAIGEGSERAIETPPLEQRRTYTILASRSGYRSREEKTVVEPGATRTLDVSLSALPAVLTLELDPASATVEVLGGEAKVAGTGATRTIEVPDPDGKREQKLRATHDGYETRESTWTPTPGERTSLKLPLAPKPALLTVELTPAEATLEVTPGGSATIEGSGETRRIEVSHPRGSVALSLRASMEGYKPSRLEWTPGPGDIARRTMTLEAVPRTTNEKEITNSIGMKLVLIPAGQFEMGSSQSEADRAYEEFKSTSKGEVKKEWFDGETPRHTVRLTKPFYLGGHEVTVGQFRRFVSDDGYRTEAEKDGKGGWGLAKDDDGNQSHKQDPQFSWRETGFAQRDDHPAVNVTWNDAEAFCKWLSRKEGKPYSLPTEAQWEYACRAGANGRFGFGNDAEDMARYGNIADGTHKADGWTLTFGQQIQAKDGFVSTAPVGSFRANGFGLHDMHGNVWEWCNDWYGTDYYANSPSDDPQGRATGVFRVYRVNRGGGWDDGPVNARSAYRYWIDPADRDDCLGFRVAHSSVQ